MNRLILLVVLACSILTAYAEVINGFKQKKLLLERDIHYLQESIQNGIDNNSSRKLKNQLKKLKKEYIIVNKKYSETEELIKTFAEVDSELFGLVSEVTNAEGTLTNIIVRYVSRVSKEFSYYTRKYYIANAYTSVGQAKIGEHICSSLYGANTVTITIGYGCNELLALGHEFAHVLYIVPHLKEYIDFWNRNQKFCDGHNESDPSYFIINSIEDHFKENYISYMKQKKPGNVLRKLMAVLRHNFEK